MVTTKKRKTYESFQLNLSIDILLNVTMKLLLSEEVNHLIQSKVIDRVLYWKFPSGYISIDPINRKVSKLDNTFNQIADGAVSTDEINITAGAIAIFTEKSSRFRAKLNEGNKEAFMFFVQKLFPPEPPTETECYLDSAVKYLPQLLAIKINVTPMEGNLKIKKTVFNLPNNKTLVLSFHYIMTDSVIVITHEYKGYRHEDNTKVEKIKALEYLLGLDDIANHIIGQR